MFRVDSFDFFCIHGLTVSKNPKLVIEEDLSWYYNLKIHLLVYHNIKITIK